LFKLCLLKQTHKEIQLSASKLYTLPLAQQRRVIRKAYSAYSKAACATSALIL
jgi:hypothetical protein